MLATIKSFVLLCAMLPFAASCADIPADEPPMPQKVVYSAPYWTCGEKDSLNVLAIGNSFTEDALANMPSILREKGDSNIVVAAITRGGGTLDQVWGNHERMEKNGYSFSERSAAGWKGYPEISCLDAALAHRKWDVVVLQQVSGLSGKKDTYEPYLSKLMALIAEQHPQARILFHKTWSYSRTSDHWDYGKYHNSQEEMSDSIDCAVSAIKDRFSMVIPSGDLLHALRKTRFNTDKDLTRDGYHLAPGFPQYAVSLLWYDMMIAPITGKETFPINFRSTPNDLNSIPTTDEMMEEIEFHIHRLHPAVK